MLGHLLNHDLRQLKLLHTIQIVNKLMEDNFLKATLQIIQFESRTFNIPDINHYLFIFILFFVVYRLLVNGL